MQVFAIVKPMYPTYSIDNVLDASLSFQPNSASKQLKFYVYSLHMFTQGVTYSAVF